MGQKCSEKKKAWDVKKVKSKSELIRQGKKDGRNSSLGEFDGPLSPAERRTCKTTPEIPRASCAPEDNVQDEEGYRAAFAEQGASASQVKGGRVLGHYLKAS